MKQSDWITRHVETPVSLRGEIVFWAILIVLGLLLSCCAPTSAALCTTPCGLELYGPIPEPMPEDVGQPGWTCPELERTERVTLNAFAREVKDERFDFACSSFAGYAVRVVSVPVWESAQHAEPANPKGRVTGLTYCQSGLVYVGNAPPLRGALSHELAHVAQRCNPHGHDSWGDAGINAAIALTEAVGDADRLRCFDGGVYVGPRDGGVCQ